MITDAFPRETGFVFRTLLRAPPTCCRPRHWRAAPCAAAAPQATPTAGAAAAWLRQRLRQTGWRHLMNCCLLASLEADRGLRCGMMSFGTGRGKVCVTKRNFTTSHRTRTQVSCLQQSMRIDITLHSEVFSIVRRGCACCLKAKASDCTVRHTPSCPQTLPFRSKSARELRHSVLRHCAGCIHTAVLPQNSSYAAAPHRLVGLAVPICLGRHRSAGRDLDQVILRRPPCQAPLWARPARATRGSTHPPMRRSI